MISELRSGYPRVFLAVLSRDLIVATRTFWLVIIQVGLQPLLMLFVFAKVLGTTNYIDGDYGRVLLPGVVALTTVMSSLQSVAYPLTQEFSVSREIEDRLLAPIPTSWLAIEKVSIGAIRGLTAAVVTYPIGVLVLGTPLWRAEGALLYIIALVLGAWTGGAVGLTLGTLLPPNRTHLMFPMVVIPMLFTGATQYPWPTLDSLLWFQILTAANPLTYCSEAVRAALVPDIPHIPSGICLLVLTAFATLFSLTGVRAFVRRAIG